MAAVQHPAGPPAGHTLTPGGASHHVRIGSAQRMVGPPRGNHLPADPLPAVRPHDRGSGQRVDLHRPGHLPAAAEAPILLRVSRYGVPLTTHTPGSPRTRK